MRSGSPSKYRATRISLRFGSHFLVSQCLDLLCGCSRQCPACPSRGRSLCLQPMNGFGSIPGQLIQCVSHCLCRCSCTRLRCCCLRLLQTSPRDQSTCMLGIRFPRETSRTRGQDSFHDLGFSALTRSND